MEYRLTHVYLAKRSSSSSDNNNTKVTAITRRLVSRLFRNKQDVALTGRNPTGPPCSVTVDLQLDWRRHDVIAWPAPVKPPEGPPWSVRSDRRGQTTDASIRYKSSPYTMCRRASNPVIKSVARNSSEWSLYNTSRQRHREAGAVRSPHSP